MFDIFQSVGCVDDGADALGVLLLWYRQLALRPAVYSCIPYTIFRINAHVFSLPAWAELHDTNIRFTI